MADTATTFAGIHNENEFYSHHYLSEIFTGDIRDTAARWRDAAESAGGASAGARTPYPVRGAESPRPRLPPVPPPVRARAPARGARKAPAPVIRNEGLFPLSAAIESSSDDTARESAETEERALVYVAATRAKKELLVLSYGAPSPLFGET